MAHERFDSFAQFLSEVFTSTFTFLPRLSFTVHFIEMSPAFALAAIAFSDSVPTVTFPLASTFTDPKSLVNCFVAPIATTAA